MPVTTRISNLDWDFQNTLAKFPRLRLGYLATPAEPMDRLSAYLGAPRLWVKHEAAKLLARTKGLLFDPVYSGKGLDGLIDQIRQGCFDRMDNVVFLHTGGSAAFFGYPETPDLHAYSQ